MGLQVPKLSGAPLRRTLRVALLGVTMLVLAGCSEADTHQIRNLAMPDRATAEGPYTYELWKWAWVAAMVTGVIVWGLIFYAVVKFRRRSDDEVPRQTRYNLPLEVFYTIAPVLMCVVFFFHTVRVQDEVTKLDANPDMTVEVHRPAVVVDVQPRRRRAGPVPRRRDGRATSPTTPTSTRPAPATRSRRSCCRSTRPSSSTCTRPT